VKLTTHFSVVPRLLLSGAIPPLLTSYVVESETELSFCTVYWRGTQFEIALYKRRRGARGSAVVKALRYTPAGRGFDS
jgi:hypothetical protein